MTSVDTARRYGVRNSRLGVAERGTCSIDRERVVRWTVGASSGDARVTGGHRTVLGKL